jgi:hypothetical protein
MKLILLLLLAVALALAAYIRLAPSDARRWHVALAPPQGLVVGGVVTGRDDAWALAAAGSLAQLDAIALATPRTQRMAGSVAAGHITWVTRSRLWGFPDYTTAEVSPQGVVLYARARFGRGDLGVNGARLRVWLARLS